MCSCWYDQVHIGCTPNWMLGESASLCSHLPNVMAMLAVPAHGQYVYISSIQLTFPVSVIGSVIAVDTVMFTMTAPKWILGESAPQPHFPQEMAMFSYVLTRSIRTFPVSMIVSVMLAVDTVRFTLAAPNWILGESAKILLIFLLACTGEKKREF